MPLAYILDSLQEGTVAKSPTMGGYVKKVRGNWRAEPCRT